VRPNDYEVTGTCQRTNIFVNPVATASRHGKK
jgi:hypothetical protein